MSGFFGPKGTNTAADRISGVQIQSSSYGLSLPVAYGRARVSCNLLWYGGFKAIAHTTSQGGGKGGNGGNTNTSYTYSASVIIGLCEGVIADIPTVWRAKAKYVTRNPATVATTSENYTVPTGGGSYRVTQFASFAGRLSVSTSTGGGEDATLPVYYSEGKDYSESGGTYTFPAAMAGKGLSISYQYVASGTVASALQQIGLGLIPGAVGQAVWTPLTTRFPSYAVPYSGVALLAGQDYALNDSAQLDNHSFEVIAPGAYSIQSNIPDADPAFCARDIMINTRYGAAFPATRVGDITLWSNYCRATGIWMSPVFDQQQPAAQALSDIAGLTNTAIVWSDGALKFVPYGDQAITGRGYAYSPNVTPVYALDDSAFIAGPGEEPVRITRKPPEDCYNSVRIEFLNRANDYNREVVEARDQAAILTFGWRPMPMITAHYFCDITAAMHAAQLILQRQLYIRNTYEFRLPWQFALLEPMDLVTLTDPGLNLSNTAVRVIEISEADDGELTITAEEFPVGVAHAALYNTGSGLGFSHNFNADPGSVAAPVFFEPPTSLTVTGLEVWAAVRGAGQYWGGCQVWVSLDGVNYKQVGTIKGAARYGTLTGPIAAGTLPVLLTNDQLGSVSAADAAQLSTLLWIGGASWEYLAYQNATLTGALAYSLTGLQRGAYGTAVAAHAAGDPFVRVDDRIGKSGALDLALIGKTIYFKFPSFNVYGGGLESIAGVPQYAYPITGTMAKLPPNAPTGATAFYEYSGIRITWTISTSPTVAFYEIRQGASFATGTLIGKVQGASYLWGIQPAAVYTIWIAAIDKFGNYSSSPVQAVTQLIAPTAIQNPTTQVVDNNVLFFWSPPAQGSLPIAHYEIRKGGATFAAAASIGLNGPSTFFTYFETAAGTYTYWIAAIDIAGNEGPAVSFTVTVSAPPDYVLRAQVLSTFSGTAVNAAASQGSLFAPFSTTQTWQSHFTGNAFASPQDQINAGDPLYLEPTLPSGSYEEVIDYGTLLPSTTITVTPTIVTLAGSVTTTVTISYSSDNVSFTSGGTGLSSILAPAFRYVKVRLDFAATGTANLIQVTRLETKLSVKQRRDGGTATCNATDTHSANASTALTTGTFIPFAYPFISANPPVIQVVSGNTFPTNGPYTAIVDYTGPVNPTGFGVFIYDKNGTRVSSPISWTATGF